MHNQREFSKLLAASFISQTGSHFLTLALSAFILMTTGSPILSGLVFVVSFLPSILVGSVLGHWVDRNLSRALIARNELISIAASIACGACIYFRLPISVLCAILAVRSILMFIGRAAATKWLKIITPPATQTNRIKLFNLAFFLSTAVSGILAAVVLKTMSIGVIVIIDALTYILGIVLYLSLSPIRVESDGAPLQTHTMPSLRETLSAIFAMPLVRTSFLLVCFSQALFQGAYSALVSYLPIQVFSLGISGVGAFQIAASLGITGGFLVNWLLPRVFRESAPTFPLRALVFSATATLALLVCVSAPIVPISLGAFCSLNFAYECVWLHHSSEFFRGSPKDHAARYQFTLSSCAAFLMSASTLGYSAAIQYLGVLQGTALVLSLGILLCVTINILATKPVAVGARPSESL